DNIARNGPVVASFPAHDAAQIMLVTDQAKMIRMKVSDMRVIGRNTAGVRLFDVADKEQVVSAALIEADDDGDDTDVIDEAVEAGLEPSNGETVSAADIGEEPEA
ncbi:MAG: DNA gyrase C-terminal beta-propeller domain-containing protein, partial [Sphingomonadaceae bacterium]